MSTLSDETMKILTDIDEMVMDETEKDSIQYDSIDFILQNLKFAHQEIFSDESQILSSRRNISKTMVWQMLFYLACVLKPFTVRRHVPSIIIFGGEGYVGSQLMLKICEFGLSSYVTVFSRGMLNANHWREKGVRIVSSLDELPEKEGKIDVVIYCADLAAFSSVARLLAKASKTNECTAFITCTLGLQRRRVYNFLGTSCILRTFTEHSDAIKRSFNTIDTEAFLSATKNIKQSLTLTIPLESDFIGSNLSEEAYAADLIARRCNDIRHLIFIIENNYVVRGITPPKARNYALHMVLGNVDNLQQSDESAPLKPQSDSMLAMRDIMRAIRDPVLKPFNEQLSKYIRVIDLPELMEVAVRVDAPEPFAPTDLFLDIHNQQMEAAGSSVASMETMEIPLEEFLESDGDDGSVGSNSSRSRRRVDPIDLASIHSNSTQRKAKKVPSKLAEKQKQKEEAKKGLESLHAEIRKRKMMLEAQRRVQNDDLYNNPHPPMHSTEVIMKIFENDMTSETSLIGIPPRVQALIGEIDEENAKADDEEEYMDDAFEGFIRLPKLSNLALTDVDLRHSQFVSTLRDDDEDESDASNLNLNYSPSQIVAMADDDKSFLSMEPNSAAVLAESFGKKGFISVLHDKVIGENLQFTSHGGIEIVHEGYVEPPTEDENTGKGEEGQGNADDGLASGGSTPISRQASGRGKDAGQMPVLSRSNSTKYAMMRGSSSKSLGSDTSKITNPTMSTSSKPSAPPYDTKSSKARPSKKT